jgi:hypothetical protein
MMSRRFRRFLSRLGLVDMLLPKIPEAPNPSVHVSRVPCE